MTDRKGSIISPHNIPTFNLEVSDTCVVGNEEGEEGNPTITSANLQREDNTLRRGKTKSMNNMKSKAKTEWQATPPRPPNAWILYRSIKLKEMKAQPDFPPKAPKMKSSNDSSDSSSEIASTAVKGKSACLQAEVSRIISTMWKNEDATVKANYIKMAEDRKKLHTDMFPDYKYKPKRQKSSSSMTKSLSMNHYSIPGEMMPKGKKMRKLSKAKSMLSVDVERAEYLARLHPRQQLGSSDYDTNASDYSPYSTASITLPSFYQHIHHPDTVKQNQLEWDAISDSNSMHSHHHHLPHYQNQHQHQDQHGLNDWSVALNATMSKDGYEQQLRKERLDEMEMHFSDLDGSTPSTADSGKIESSFSSNGGTTASDFNQQPTYFGSFGPDHIHHNSPSEIRFTSRLPQQSKAGLAFTPIMSSSNSREDGQQFNHQEHHQIMANHAFPHTWQAVTNADFFPYLGTGVEAPCPTSLGSQILPFSPGYTENDMVSPTSSAFQQQATIGDATIFLSQLNVGPTYNRTPNIGISAEDLAILNGIDSSSSSPQHSNALHLHATTPSRLSPHQIRQQQYQQWLSNNLNHSFATPDAMTSQQYSDSHASNQLLRPTLYRNAHSESGHDRGSATTNSARSSPATSAINFNRQDGFNTGPDHQNMFPPNSFSAANDQQIKQQQPQQQHNSNSMPSHW